MTVALLNSAFITYWYRSITESFYTDVWILNKKKWHYWIMIVLDTDIGALQNHAFIAYWQGHFWINIDNGITESCFYFYFILTEALLNHAHDDLLIAELHKHNLIIYGQGHQEYNYIYDRGITKSSTRFIITQVLMKNVSNYVTDTHYWYMLTITYWRGHKLTGFTEPCTQLLTGPYTNRGFTEPGSQLPTGS